MVNEVVRVYNSLKCQLIQMEGSREVVEKLQTTIPTVSIVCVPHMYIICPMLHCVLFLRSACAGHETLVGVRQDMWKVFLCAQSM